jgi:membrane fusion protein, multidrug efflux system
MQQDQIETKPPAPPAAAESERPSTSHTHTSGWQRLVVWLAVLLTFGIIFWLVLRHHEEVKTTTSRRGMAGPVPISQTVAKKGSIGVYLDAIGTVTPIYTDSITSQVTGMVTQVHYKEGQLVRKGGPLIDIDPRPFEAQLLQAQGALERDTYVLEEAQMDLQRYREAWARNGIPKQTLDDQEKIVLQDQGTVKNDQGTVRYDEVQVAYCHITAPIGGRVGLRLMDPGNVVQATGTTILAVITELQPITVIFTISEDSLGQVEAQTRKGKPLPVDAYDRAQQNKIASGKLLTFDNQIDTTTGTVKMRATFDNKNNELFPNQFVNAKLLVDTLDGVTLIPTSAIQHNGQASFVYVVQNGVAQIRNIKTGVSEGGVTAVEGINPGDTVANSSFDKLQNDSKVTISKQPLPTATSESSAP